MPRTTTRSDGERATRAATRVAAWGARAAGEQLEPMEVVRRSLRDDDVRIAIDYCGVCHSDLHQVRDDWHDDLPTRYPCVPGHEIVGRVLDVGRDVTRFEAGDVVGVGCMVDSCLDCEPCRAGLEQFCESSPTLTYNDEDRRDGSVTMGGYSTEVVVRDHFVLRIPDQLEPAEAAPLLCAGITTWSALRHWNVGVGSKVAVVGIGGLGHMALQLADALGAHVTAITTSPEKVAGARELGADVVSIASDAETMEHAERRFDLIISTIPDAYDPDPFLRLLAVDGTLVNVGALGRLEPGPAGFRLAACRGALAGSMIGGIVETQELLEFCAKHDIAPRIERIDMADVNRAFRRMERGDVGFRFVIELASLAADDDRGR